MQQKLLQAFFVAFSDFCIKGFKGLKQVILEEGLKGIFSYLDATSLLSSFDGFFLCISHEKVNIIGHKQHDLSLTVIEI